MNFWKHGRWFLALAGIWALGWAGAAQAADIAVIAHEAFPLDRISIPVLKEIYQGKKQFEGGVRIQPIDQQDSAPIKALFIKKVIGKELKVYKGYWLIRVFREGVVPPVQVEDSTAVIQKVRSNPGAIGYVWTDDRLVKGIKTLLTIPTGD